MTAAHHKKKWWTTLSDWLYEALVMETICSGCLFPYTEEDRQALLFNSDSYWLSPVDRTLKLLMAQRRCQSKRSECSSHPETMLLPSTCKLTGTDESKCIIKTSASCLCRFMDGSSVFWTEYVTGLDELDLSQRSRAIFLWEYYPSKDYWKSPMVSWFSFVIVCLLDCGTDCTCCCDFISKWLASIETRDSQLSESILHEYKCLHSGAFCSSSLC